MTAWIALLLLSARLIQPADAPSTIIDRGGYPCSIAARSDGPVIAYGQGKLLRLARLTSGGWVVETLADGGGDYGYSGMDLASGPDGSVAVATHTGYEGGAIVGRIEIVTGRPDGPWNRSTVDLFGSSPSVAWIEGGPAVAYARSDSSGTQLRYAYRRYDGTWDIDVVEATVERDLYGLKRRRVFWPSLAVDSDGVPAIAYGWSLSRCDGYKSCDQIRYTWLAADGTWPYQVAVKTIPSALRLDYTDAGEPGLAYVAGTGPNVVSRIAGVWSNTFLQWPGSGRAGSIDFDAGVLTEYDFGGGDLWMHRGEWSRIASAGVVGQSNSVYVDEAGHAHLCASDLTTGTLRYLEVAP